MGMAFRKMTSAKDYYNEYKARYLGKEGGLLPIVDDDIRKWMDEWLGFNWFLREWSNMSLFNLHYFRTAKEQADRHPKEEQLNVLADRFSTFISWKVVQIIYFMEHLIEQRREVGLGAVLEEIALRHNGYLGALDHLVKSDEEALYRFNDERPGLHESIYEFFLSDLKGAFDDKTLYRKCVQQLERSDVEEIFQGLIDHWLLGRSESVINGMFNWVGFYYFLKQQNKV